MTGGREESGKGGLRGSRENQMNVKTQKLSGGNVWGSKQLTRNSQNIDDQVRDDRDRVG